jgi:ABC-2 type transport system permease protein
MGNFLRTEFDQFLTFGRVEWQKVLTYRVSVVVYRVSEMIETIILIAMWTFIYAQGGGLIKGYTLPEMITYVLIGGLCASITRNFIHGSISRDIDKGDLSLFLVKPISYIKYNIYSEFGGLILTIFASILSQAAVIVFFFDKIVLNTDWRVTGLIVLMLILAFFIEILIGLIIGFFAFWTEGEVGGFQQLAYVLKRFFAGAYFPLSLLPVSFSFVGYYLPFAYSYFIPAQLYLGKIDIAMALKGVVVQLVWICLLSIIVRVIWKLGLKKYEATGS